MRDLWIRHRRWQVIESRVARGVARVTTAGTWSAERPTFLIPPDRARPVGTPRRWRWASVGHVWGQVASAVRGTERDGCPTGLQDATTELLAWQLEPVLAVLAGTRRLLLADRVGLGKTIQAAYIVRSMLDRDPGARILILSPTALTTQWQQELRLRVSVEAQVADAMTFSRMRVDLPYLSTPWGHGRVWIASPDFIKQRHIRESVPDDHWAVLVVDEAHQVAGPSARHDAVQALASRARQVVLLTATPHDGNNERFARLCGLGSRGDDRLRVFRRTTLSPHIAGPPARRMSWLRVPVSDGEARLLAMLDSFERSRHDDASGLPLLCALFRKRLMSTVSALLASVARRLAILDETPGRGWLQPGLFDDPDEDLCDGEEIATLRAATGLPTARERAWLQRLQRLGTSVLDEHQGGRVLALRRLLHRSRDVVVVFTQYRDSIDVFARAVPRWRRVVALHGGLAPSEQRRVLDAFLSGAADTLVTTDVASQGLNLQHVCRWVIACDAPWTPLRLEQRIGRVDRLGQTRRVHATLLTTRHPFDIALRERLETRAQQADDAPLATCRRWAAPAIGLAAWHTRLRALGARWRGPAGERRPVVAVRRGLPANHALAHDDTGTRVVEVTMSAAGTGAVVERTVVAVPARVTTRAVEAWSARRARQVAARVARRARVLARAQLAPSVAVQPSLFGIETTSGVVSGTASTGVTAVPEAELCLAVRDVAWLK